MQKNVPKYTPDWVATVPFWAEASKREVTYALCNDRRTLLWFANQRAVEYHPTLVTVDTPRPIDPSRARPRSARGRRVLDWPCGSPHLVRQALDRRRSRRRGQDQRRQGRARVRARSTTTRRSRTPPAATRAIAARAEQLDPEIATTAFMKEDRGGKVFVDSTRAGGATVVAAYSPRVRPGVPVSFPLAGTSSTTSRPPTSPSTPRSSASASATRGPSTCPAPRRLRADLVAEGHAIPIARVQAMHEGKRRARARRTDD